MADRVLEAAPDLHEQVKTGSLSVHRALAEVKRRKKRAVIAERIDAAEGLHLDAAVHHGDVLDELRKIGAATARLVFADPPYNQGIDYGSGPDADRLSDGVYMTWVEDWLRECLEILTEDGSLWVMISDEYAAEYAVLLRDLGLKVRSWIKWYETFGVNCQNNFNRCSRHLFYCVKDEHKFVFNSDAVTRLSARQERYNDKRAVAGGKLWDNVWQIARLTGTSTERIPDVPTQLPEELLTPVVLCASDPGDLVIDPFAGSGTTGAVCVKNKRKFIGIDNNEEYVRIANSRLKMCSQA
jgi:site-specific DNA-methyltransferase (adenine-specific)